MVKNLFPSRIYISSLISGASNTRFRKELLDEIPKIQAADSEGQNWSEKNYWGGYTSYGSWDQLHKFSSTFETLEKKLRTHVMKFSKSLNWDVDPRELKCNSLWVNIMPQGTAHSFHIHPLSVISGTYYVDVPRGSSGIQFEDPRHGFMMAAPPRKSNSPQEDKPHYTHKPVPGEVILFESWMRHQVPPNPAERPRISISFNYHWER